MTAAHRHRFTILASFAAIYLIWGSTYLAIRVAIDTVPPFLMAGIRFLLAGIPMVVWMKFRGAPWPSLREWKSAAILGGLMMAGGNGLVTWGEQYLSSGAAALIVGTVPLFMVTLDGLFFQGTKPRGWILVGLVSGFLGIVVLVGPTGPEISRVHPLGAALIVVASISWALGSLMSRRAVLPKSIAMASGMEMVAGGAILLVAGTLTGEWSRFDIGAVSGQSAIAVLHLVVLGSMVALSAYQWLLRETSAAAVSTYAFVNPVVAVILGWLVLGEHIGTRTGLSALLIIGAVILIHWARTRVRTAREFDRVDPSRRPIYVPSGGRR